MWNERNLQKKEKALKMSFFSQRVLHSIVDFGATHKFDTEKAAAFQKAHEFMHMVNQGDKVFTGTLSKFALDSASAYHTAVRTVYRFEPDKNLSQLFSDVESCFQQLSKGLVPDDAQLQQAQQFFTWLVQSAFDETAASFKPEKGQRVWPSTIRSKSALSR